MSESNENKNKCCDCDCGPYVAFWVLRLWLGIRALLAGLEKFGAYQAVQKPLIDPTTGQPDASGVMVNVNIKYYSLTNYSGIPSSLKDRFTNEPLLPSFSLSLFDHLLGPLFILSGAMLLLGIATRLSLFLQGLIYIALTIGLILIHQEDGVAWLGIHIALVAFALMLAKYNKFALIKKW
jgi:thiosulfate dehydrogenase (quinone) large subunit